MEHNLQAKQANYLILLGLVLFLFGLIVGFFVQNMVNPRMALSAHLEGVMNGMFLMLLGLIWKRLLLSTTWLNITFGLVVYGTFANLAAVIMAAITGFGKMMPIAGGKGGEGITESAISFLLISLALCMLTVCVIVIVGVYKKMNQNPNETPK
ncbi:hydrogenase [Sphingobacteriales bacterium UPWRP_1]|nr:hydrogenase [Sphingobacteriales bacterium TSM_CSS]PSJ76816.1 hydrogenase [Sphingobacteriales bacterium UPWRP_1]